MRRHQKDNIPDIVVTRVNTQITIDVRNIRNRLLLIYQADNSKSTYTLIDEYDSNDLPIILTVSPDLDVKYKAAFVDLGNSVNITEVNTDDEPPYIEFELKGGTHGVIVYENYNIDWGTDLEDIPIIELSNLQAGSYSQSIQTRKST